MPTNENPALAGGVSEDGHAAKLIVSEDTSTTAPAQANRLAFHPLADLFPLMEGREFEELVADIKANGLIEDIVLFDGMILDGRNRYRACMAAGVPPTTYNADKWIADPAAFVISANIRRRHLNREQRGELLIKIIAAAPEKSDRQIAKSIGVDHKTIGAARAKGEQLGSIPQLRKTVGADGKARPRGPRARRQLRLDRKAERHSRLRSGAVATADDDEDDEEDDAALTAAAVRGFIYRAREARDNATYEGFIGSDITEAMIDAADDAAAAWSIAAQKLRGMVGQNPLIDAWDKATRAQRHEFIRARKIEVMRAQQQIRPAAVEPTTPAVITDPFEIPPMLDRTGGQR